MGDTKFNATSNSRPRRNDKLFKVIVVGESSVGKTSFIFRYVHGVYTGDFKATIGVDFALKKIDRSEHETIRLQIWDIAGQQEYNMITGVYYRNASACVIMFDVSEADTFRAIDKWKTDVDKKVRLKDGRPLPCLLLGNKTDLPGRSIEDEDIKSFCRERDFIGWSTISVKDNKNVDGPMRFLVETLLDNESSSDYDLDQFTTSDGNIRLPPDLEQNQKSCCLG